MEERNPFVIRQIARGSHFADRETEVERVVAALKDPGGGLVVFGHRRMGKSSVLERAAEKVRADGAHAAVATLATASDPADAARRVLEAIQQEVGRSGREIIEAIAGNLNVGMEIQPPSLPGELPTIRFDFGQRAKSSPTKLLPDVLTAVDAEMRRRGLILGIALDEFQRIHEWGGEDAEWALRDAMQRHEALGYVLAGSQRGLIQAMIAGRGRAFWKLFDPMEFGAMADEELAEWIHQEAHRTGIRFELTTADRIVQLAGPRTRDVVQLARETWSRCVRSKLAAPPDADAAFESIVDAQAALYQKLWMDLTATQQRVLRALAAEPAVPLTAKYTLDRYELGPKSTAHKAVEALVAAEHLIVGLGGGYGFDDPFFGRWVQRYTLEDIGRPIPLLPEPSKPNG